MSPCCIHTASGVLPVGHSIFDFQTVMESKVLQSSGLENHEHISRYLATQFLVLVGLATGLAKSLHHNPQRRNPLVHSGKVFRNRCCSLSTTLDTAGFLSWPFWSTKLRNFFMFRVVTGQDKPFRSNVFSFSLIVDHVVRAHTVIHAMLTCRKT